MSRGKPTPQTASNLRSFAEQLEHCAIALRTVADEMDARSVKEVIVVEGHAMAIRSVEQYLEKFLQSVRQGFARVRKDRGDFGGLDDSVPTGSSTDVPGKRNTKPGEGEPKPPARERKTRGKG